VCGICGIVALKSDRLFAPHLLVEMVDRQRHRGPDDEGYLVLPRLGSPQRAPQPRFLSAGELASWSEPTWLGFGHCRLAIQDPLHARQPMTNESGEVWLNYNGEVYNFPELRQRLLSRHTFRTHSDTEVIIHLYEEMGRAALAELNGIFALALLDLKRGSLLLARDPMGVKPLYYAEADGFLLFASEVKSLLATGLLKPEVDEEALELFLTFRYVPSPRTLFRGVRKLAPGELLEVALRPGGARAKVGEPTTFRRSGPREPESRPEREVVEELRGLLLEAVTRQLIADVPVGLFLSGGVDSASMAALVTHCGQRGRHSFTVTYEQSAGVSEAEGAEQVARHFGTEHHTVSIGPGYFVEHWPEVVRHLDEPLGTSSALATYAVAKLASQFVKVGLSGQGADELWGGYWRYLGEKYGSWYRMLPRWVGEGLIPEVAGRLQSMGHLARGLKALAIEEEDRRLAEVLAIFTAEERRRLLGRPRAVGHAEATAGMEVLAPHRERYRRLEGGTKLCYLDTRLWMPDDLLMVCDKMAMAASVEMRVPFLDLTLVEAAERAPANLRVKGSQRKYLLRRAMEPYLPARFRQRPKRDFQLPLGEWFRGPLAGFLRETVLRPSGFCASRLDRGFIAQMLDEHRRRVRPWTLQLYSLLALEAWHQEFIS
jgi:asparagine synthase (glutamine-hydrolysing)